MCLTKPKHHAAGAAAHARSSQHHQAPSRRSFLARTFGTSLVGGSILEQAFLRAALARAQAPSAAAQPALFDLQKVGDGVFAAIARPQTLLNSNAAIFENANDLLIVDAHSKPSAAAALAAQIKRELTDKPIRYIVNTHFHWDHTQGDPAYRQIAPHAEFVASTATRNLLAELGTARAKQSGDEARASLDGYQQHLATAKDAAERAHLEGTIADVKAYLAEMRDYQPELPDVTFDRSLVLHDKAHEIHLAFCGRGHTAGDVVVFCPQSKVIATGDLLHGWFPFIADGYPQEWPKTLAAVSDEFAFDVVVGGHGTVQHGKKRLQEMAGYIAEVTELVSNGKQKGQSLAELQNSIVPTKLRSLDADYREFLLAQMSDRSAGAEQIFAGSVKTNVAEVYGRLKA